MFKFKITKKENILGEFTNVKFHSKFNHAMIYQFTTYHQSDDTYDLNKGASNWNKHSSTEKIKKEFFNGNWIRID